MHHSDLAFCFSLSSPLLSRFTSAAVSRPRHPTLPSAADINQPLCGKQREERSERRREKGEIERAWRQPVIRTNVDGLRIADQEEQKSFAPLFLLC